MIVECSQLLTIRFLPSGTWCFFFDRFYLRIPVMTGNCRNREELKLDGHSSEKVIKPDPSFRD